MEIPKFYNSSNVYFGGKPKHIYLEGEATELNQIHFQLNMRGADGHYGKLPNH